MIDGRLVRRSRSRRMVRRQYILGCVRELQQCHAVLGSFDRGAAEGHNFVDSLLLITPTEDWVLSQQRRFSGKHQLGLVTGFLVVLFDIDRKTWGNVNI